MVRQRCLAARATMLACAWWLGTGSVEAQDVGAIGGRPDADVDSRPVTLREVLEHADEQAPSMRVAIARLELGEAERVAASPDFPANPELEIAGGPRVTAQTVDADLSASIVQRLEIAGEPGARRAAADRTAARFEAELEQARWQVHQEVHAAYHLALVARARAEAMRDVVTFAEELFAIAERRVAAGEASQLDARIASVDIAQARQAAVAAEQEYVAARLTLAEVSGLPTDPLPEPIGNLDPPQGAPPLALLLRRALEQSPDVRLLEARVAEAEAALEAEERDAWPEPWIGLTYAREGSTGPGQAASDIGMVVLGIPLPFVQTNQGERARARAELEVARAELESASARLRPRISRSASAVDAAARRLEVYATEILPRFAESLQMLRRGFELGELDLLEVAVARERFMQLQRDALDAFAEYHRALAELERELGAEVMGEDDHHGAEERP